MMYKLAKENRDTGEINTVFKTISESSGMSIPFVPDNTDYAQFKKDILEGAELQDAEGNTMSAEQATQFVKELP